MKFTIRQVLEQAIAAHKEAKLDQAEQLYKTILESQPENLDAINNLSVLLLNSNRAEEAEQYAKKAIKLKPDFAEAHNNLGAILDKLERFDEAEESYKEAIELKPNYFEAYSNLGVALQKLNRLDESEINCKKTIELNPNYARGYYNLGITLQKLNRLDESEINYKKATELKPDYIEAYNDLGIVFEKLNKSKEAAINFKKAIEIKPNYAEALFNMGRNLKVLGKFDEAGKFFDQVLKIYPEDHFGAILELAAMGKKNIPNKTPKKYMQSYYRTKSKGWDKQKKSTYQGHELIENAFKQTYTKEEKMDILDLGCGTGSLVGFLRSYARRLVGVDLSSDMIVEAKKKGLYDTLHNKELDRYLEETSSQYDVVVAAAVMIHFFDLENTFALIRNSLKKNGKFIFSVFEGKKKDRELNSFLTYSHSNNYINTLADRLKFKINYKQSGVHEYHEGNPVDALIYVFQKSN